MRPARVACALCLVWLAAPLPGRADAPEAAAEAQAEPSDHVLTPDPPTALCAVADSNLRRAEDAILRGAGRLPPATSAPWDHRAAPLYLDRVQRRFALTQAERALLQRQGLVVQARRTRDGFAGLFHELYQSQMPLYVSVDALFHAVYASHDALIMELEQARLSPLLGSVLSRLHKNLSTAGYPPQIARDLDLYLTVPRRLLKGQAAALFGQEAAISALVAAAERADAMQTLDLFGRPRVIDFTQYTPRGHYAEDPARQAYFRAVMWLSRLEFNLVSRSCRSSAPGDVPDPRETPREAAAALALADLIQRAGVTADMEVLEQAFTLIAGRREDVSPRQLRDLRRRVNLQLVEAGAADRLRAALGDGFQRTVNLHYMPSGTTVLPAITTLLGARVVADAAAMQPLVHDRIPARYLVTAADIGVLLGHDRARVYLEGDLRSFPQLGPALDQARARMWQAPTQSDLYSGWLAAIHALSVRPQGARPSFMSTPAYEDLRLNGALAAYGQLRHNNVLFAGQTYDFGGCEIPDGYVEPAPAAYDALLAYAERGAQVWQRLDEADTSRGRAYFARLARALRVLRALVQDELDGRPLSLEGRRFLSMVAEIQPMTTGHEATYTGWYFDLFFGRRDGLSRAAFIADYYTSTQRSQVAYLGGGDPGMGVFVVDTGGKPRVLVGPVAQAYQHVGPLARRLTDQGAGALSAQDRAAPWAASYTPPPPPEPTGLSVFYDLQGPVQVTSARALGPITIELLDHHREVLLRLKANIRAGQNAIRVPRRAGPAPEALAVQVGEHRQIVDQEVVSGNISGTIGAEAPPEAQPEAPATR